MFGGRDFDLDVLVHAEAVSEAFGDGDLSAFRYAHVSPRMNSSRITSYYIQNELVIEAARGHRAVRVGGG